MPYLSLSSAQYARDTQHEKIQRGLAVGIAMVSLSLDSGSFIVLYMLKYSSHVLPLSFPLSFPLSPLLPFLVAHVWPTGGGRHTHRRAVQRQSLCVHVHLNHDYQIHLNLQFCDGFPLSVSSTGQDPLLRRSGMYTVAMAYCGSGDNRAIRRLLHVAVSHCMWQYTITSYYMVEWVGKLSYIYTVHVHVHA